MPNSPSNSNNNNTVGWFNPDFDKELGESLIASCQKAIGCFECGTPDKATLRCSRCKVAKYCSKACQKADWKKTHKETCGIWMDNQADKGPLPGAPVPILLRSVHLMGNDDFEHFLRVRRDLFLQAAAQAGPEIKKPIAMNFMSAIVDMFGKLRVVIVPSFIVENDKSMKIHQVPHLVLEEVASDENDINKFEQSLQISTKVFDKVVDAWVEFYGLLEQSGIKAGGITWGSGLYNRIDELEEKFQKRGITGLIMIPSSHLLF